MSNYHPKKRPDPARAKRRSKTKQPPHPAKPCVVRFLPTGSLMNYREDTKQLFLDGSGAHYVFTSKARAGTAIWRASQDEPGSYKYYVLVEFHD